MRRIYLIDCPGVVPVSSKDSDTDTVLKGVVRVENLYTPAEHIPALLERVRTEYVERTYGLEHREGGWVGEEGAAILLSMIAKKSGKLLKGGEPDQEAAAKMVLNDWIRGKIPFYVAPPSKPSEGKEEPVGEVSEETMQVLEEQEKRLGELLGERKVKGVQQPISKVVVMSKFIGDDARKHVEEDEEEDEMEVDEEEEADDDEEEEGGEGGVEMGSELDEHEDGEEEEEKEEDAGELAWEDLFPGDAGPSKLKAKPSLMKLAGEIPIDASENESDEEAIQVAGEGVEVQGESGSEEDEEDQSEDEETEVIVAPPKSINAAGKRESQLRIV